MTDNDRYKLAMTLQTAVKRIKLAIGSHVLKDGTVACNLKIIQKVAEALDSDAKL